MRCETALERMLEAEPETLRGEGDGELVRHLAGCARCARIAATLVEESDAVDRALDEWAGEISADATADAALAAIRATPTDEVAPPGFDQGSGAVGVRRVSRRTWMRRAWVPLAAAAALAGILFLTRHEMPFPPASGSDGPAVEPRVSVTPPPDRNVAIMETENPNITIVWLYQRGGS